MPICPRAAAVLIPLFVTWNGSAPGRAESGQSNPVEYPRSVFNQGWISSEGVAIGWLKSADDLGPDGPERVKRTWFLTCWIDAWAAGLVPFDIPGESPIIQRCFEWSQLPTTAMQSRGDPTPYTAGEQNSQMIVATLDLVMKELTQVYPSASQAQLRAATSCVVDAIRQKGSEVALAETMVANGPCFRLAGISDAHKAKKLRKRRK